MPRQQQTDIRSLKPNVSIVFERLQDHLELTIARKIIDQINRPLGVASFSVKNR